MKIYNTMSRQKEDFIPLESGKIRMYACGPTVYNYFHIGNARAFLFFDVVRRYFLWCGYDVTYVQNITDIDDKIIAQANDEKLPFTAIAEKYSQAFLEDSSRLGVLPPDFQPRATEVMAEIIAFIHELEKKGYAYEAEGDVYFSTQALESYGSLSGKKVDEQMVGARVLENLNKRHPADFTLWKASKPGEPVWDSPWGKGRPGWHTECVVMSRRYLGETFDIHGGGIDLIFPHHENELAQAQAMTGKPLANYWMHNGFLNIDGEKMSKSLKNFFTARDILDQYDAEVLRLFFLSKHYRSPIDFDRELVEEASRALKNFYSALKEMEPQKLMAEGLELIPEAKQSFIQALEDDFNTAKAIAILFDLASLAKKQDHNLEDRQWAAYTLFQLGKVLGFFANYDKKQDSRLSGLSAGLVELILSYRKQAREQKDWAHSDRIRDDLKALGIEIKDTKDGCQWQIKE
ncbi:MAG: cysteine--tRNA ligase [Candidatus Cloacimonetes bacterium]|nr:cysteine--tRNA ligase [Candidatus Cloacimonadota bacterium]